MNILITNFHSIKNKGDLGIVLGLMDGLKVVNKSFNFAIIGRNIEERSWWESRGVKFFLPLLKLPKYKKGRWFSSLTNKASAMLFFGNYYLSLAVLRFPRLAFWYYKDSEEMLKTLTAYNRSAIIISKGGSFFREPEYRVNILPVGIMSHLHQLLTGLMLKKAVILSAQSFGPINNPYSKLIMRRALLNFKLITTRETDSKAFLNNKLKISKNVVLAGDLAFLLKIKEVESEDNKILHKIVKDKKNGHICVGLTVRSWSEQKQFRSYVDSLAAFINEYAVRGFRFYLMPQSIGPSESEDDRIIFKKILEALPDDIKFQVRVVNNDLKVNELLGLYGRMDYFVATRLHSAIFALLSGVPVMAIGYEPKTAGVFKDLDLNRFVLDIRNFSPEIIKRTFETLLKTPKDIFSSAGSRAVILSKKNIEAILAVINLSAN
ncbi:MAG: polysaccharide pyruvyl transferase family protein [Patescibacteria group bacterium]|jgi:colanic acid/amylovoran biosynthesis protein